MGKTFVYDDATGEVVTKEELAERRAKRSPKTARSEIPDRTVERGVWRIDRKTGDFVSLEEWCRRNPDTSIGLQIVKDIEPYQNIIDGKVITSRKHHRDFKRAHGVTEVGNEKLLRERPFKETPGLKDAIKQSFEHLRSGGEVPRAKFTQKEWAKGFE